ncbi:type II inositol 1,4,5-trisphosphate 5-phosphatase isoform X2 [Varanus komodoensis]|uniref:type II inositol 1,4,5-trisphosphate 5-phosphatase isoform X2 n=1 Tax=Varanus komodoensis TaxID=61221 RepID=UPI001CF77AF2|nr:type II inositol 1,4,5-trisphosphate 5-phosphatase isoform X2 [Varanus komodoensis]
MDQSVAIQDSLAAGETCLAAVQGIVEAGGQSVGSRLLGLVESHGKIVICLYTHRRMAISAEDVCLDRVLLVHEGVTVEEVVLESDMPVLGSDVTVRIISSDTDLLVQMPFGSQTQMFLKEVRKCLHSAAASSDRVEQRGETVPTMNQQYSAGGAGTAASPRPSKRRSEGTGEMACSSSVLVPDKTRSLCVHMSGLRESIIRSQLLQKQDLYTHLKNFRFFVGTYNVNGQSPRESLHPWLSQGPVPPDVYCVGWTEWLAPCPEQCAFGGPDSCLLDGCSFQELDLSKEAFFFNDTSKEEEWFRAVTESLHPGAKYAKVKLVRLVGILLLLYVRTELAGNVAEVEAETVGTGIMGRMGNKGGVAIRFRLHSTTICLVNAHLAAHIEEHERRNQDFHDICARMQFRPLESSLPPLTICKHDVVLWLGDLNYRLEEKDLVLVKKLIEARDFHALYQHDQLKSQMEAKRAFQGFAEGEISFPPTYKYNMGSDDWDTSEKCRTPAWCDRILFKGNNVSQLSYRSHMSLRNSDHKPVSAVFEVGVKVVEEQLYRRVFEDIVRSLDKMENASIPSVTLSKREFLFKDVKYMQLRAQSFTIHNGPVPCQFKLINKPDEDSYCKPWLTAHPSKGFLLPEAEVTVELELFVNKATATNLNSGEDTLEDILVLHLDRGKDYFLSVSGNYLPSCFGSPIQALRYMRGPIQEMPPETIRDLTLMPLWPEEEVSWGEEPLDIPKELCMMEDLFQQPGLRTEFERIRDCLDSGMLDTLVASNHSVAEALLLFLESLPEPVICYQLYDNSLECADSFVLSHQVASMLPSSHKNVFHYLIAFLRELLQHSGKNLLDVKTLASIFGGILLRPPPGHPKTGISEKQKAQQFIQQFLLGEGSTP